MPFFQGLDYARSCRTCSIPVSPSWNSSSTLHVTEIKKMPSLFLKAQVSRTMTTKRLYQWKKINWPYLWIGLPVSCLHSMIEGAEWSKITPNSYAQCPWVKVSLHESVCTPNTLNLSWLWGLGFNWITSPNSLCCGCHFALLSWHHFSFLNLFEMKLIKFQC